MKIQIKMSDTIGRLQKYAYLVPEEHKLYVVGSRVGFSKEGLEILATHSLVEVELKDDIREFLNAISDD